MEFGILWVFRLLEPSIWSSFSHWLLTNYFKLAIFPLSCELMKRSPPARDMHVRWSVGRVYYMCPSKQLVILGIGLGNGCVVYRKVRHSPWDWLYIESVVWKWKIFQNFVWNIVFFLVLVPTIPTVEIDK